MATSQLNSSSPAGVSESAGDQVEVFSLDLSGRLTGTSQGLIVLLGLQNGIAPGATLATVLRPNGPETVESLQRMLIATCVEKGHASVRVAVPGAGSRQAQIHLSLLSDSSGNPACIVASCRDALESETALPRVGVRVAQPESSSRATQVRHVDGQDFIIASPIMHKFMGLVERVAGHTETVLITGETGVGKELIARTIHHSSHRRAKPWIDVNCAALPDNLVESELFGFEKGAFSGADSAKAGMFELADKGTLFLDEIGELPLHTQVKLLRVLDGQPFYRLGGSRKIHVDVRVVAATNQDLEAAVEAGKFRRDLYHRLSQFHLRVPPLRERPEDIAALAESALSGKMPPRTLAPAALSVLHSHAWPGNIRELRNIITKACMESPGAEISREQIQRQLPAEAAQAPNTRSGMIAATCDLGSMEEQAIRSALEQTAGHRTRAAEKLGISRRTLTRKIKEYGLTDAPTEGATLGFISTEQQKFFRSRVDIPVAVRNARGEQATARATNLSTGGMGLDGLPANMKVTGEIEVSFPLPDSDITMKADARVVWVEGARVGIHFTRMVPAMFEHLQQWTKKKMKEEGWELPG